MLFKICNYFVNFNHLILTFLIFNIYFKILKFNALFFIITQKLITMKKTINEITKINTSKQIQNA